MDQRFTVYQEKCFLKWVAISTYTLQCLVIFEVVSGSEGIISSKNNSCVKLMQIKICDRNEVLRNRFQKNARNFLICEKFLSKNEGD